MKELPGIKKMFKLYLSLKKFDGVLVGFDIKHVILLFPCNSFFFFVWRLGNKLYFETCLTHEKIKGKDPTPPFLKICYFYYTTEHSLRFLELNYPKLDT